MRKRLFDLIKILQKEKELLERRAAEVSSDANDIARTSRGSWSQAGDRYHSRVQADLVKDSLEKFDKLERGIKEGLKTETKSVSVPGYVSMRSEGEILKFYVVGEPVYLKEVRLVSEKSELGRSVVAKKTGDKIRVNEKEYEILEIG